MAFYVFHCLLKISVNLQDNARESCKTILITKLSTPHLIMLGPILLSIPWNENLKIEVTYIRLHSAQLDNQNHLIGHSTYTELSQSTSYSVVHKLCSRCKYANPHGLSMPESSKQLFMMSNQLLYLRKKGILMIAKQIPQLPDYRVSQIYESLFV